MAKMRAVQVSQPNGPLELVERDIPEPSAGAVRIKVETCGICHSDAFTKEGTFPGLQYPRVPGHEIAGVLDALGGGVAGWTTGQRVAVGWHGGHCGFCASCRRVVSRRQHEGRLIDFPIGGFSPPEGRLARGFKPPAFSRFLFQSAVKSAESF